MNRKTKGLLLIISTILLIIAALFIYLNRQPASEEKLVPEPAPITQPIEPTPEEAYQGVKLQAVGSYTGSGLAIRGFNDSKFTHSIEARIPNPPDGKFYEGWLVKNTAPLEFFSTGKLIKQDDQYVLSYQSDKDQSEYSQVVVTEETEALGLDGVPETHVLEGAFQSD